MTGTMMNLKRHCTHWETPLPKYIDRPVEPDDEDRYQNIFATEEGAVVVLLQVFISAVS